MSETARTQSTSANDKGLDIVILAGGISHERDVSLRSGRRAADALAARGHRITVLDADATLLTTLTTMNPDVVWPVLHGAIGEDGALLTLLEATGIPIVGPRGPAAALAWSKPTAKELVQRAGYATPRSASLSRETFRDLGANNVLSKVIESLGTPLVVKPAHGGSAQGLTIVNSADELPRAMVDAYTYADVALVEQRINGTELGVTVVNTGDGPVALPAVEIVPREGIYSFEARYNAGETLFYAPARVEADVAGVAAQAAVEIHELLGLRQLSRVDLILDAEGTVWYLELLGLRQLSRVDLILDAEGTVWFLEANTLPGLTETSLVPQAIEASGRSLGEVYDAIVRAAQ